MTGDVAQYSTVEQCAHSFARAWISHHARIDAQYDAIHGYPTRVCVDPTDIADDEFGFVTSDFKVIHVAK